MVSQSCYARHPDGQTLTKTNDTQTVDLSLYLPNVSRPLARPSKCGRLHLKQCALVDRLMEPLQLVNGDECATLGEWLVLASEPPEKKHDTRRSTYEYFARSSAGY